MASQKRREDSTLSQSTRDANAFNAMDIQWLSMDIQIVPVSFLEIYVTPTFISFWYHSVPLQKGGLL